jgi:geranylgeranyl pyrophosphate synthase/predicted secreted hydrolase
MQPKPTESRKRDREWGEGIKEGRSPVLSAAAPPTEIKGWKHYFPSPLAPSVDIDKLDLPCDHAPLEWWYYNCHLTAKNGQRFSAFSSFFRQASGFSRTEQEGKEGKPFKEFYHACTWALIDVDSEKYYADSQLDHRACENIVKRLEGKKLVHAEAPLFEIASKGRLPRPDRMMKKAAECSSKELKLNFDNECLLHSEKPSAKDVQGPLAPKLVYKVKTFNPLRNMALDLTFVPQMQPVLHGLNGVVNEMYYYYIPRCTVYGTVTVAGVVHEVEGQGWYDREFGGSEDQTGKDALDAWSWFALQLSDDSEFSLFNVVDRDTHHEKELVGVWTRRDGTRIAATDTVVTYSNLWTSLNTYVEYPLQWKITSASLNLELHVGCAFNHQEFMSVLVTGGGFYEGRIHAQGVRAGQAVTATGFLERKNHTNYNDTAGLLKNVSRFVKKTLNAMYPLDASEEWVNNNVLGRHCTGKGVLPKMICDTLFKPVRSLIDRGGKSWRSLILVSALNALFDDYYDGSRYIAIAELLHVGSLIIDDIQDESVVRRGGKTVHIAYGVPTAINSGTGCYFMAPILAGVDELSPEKACAVYQLYFDVLRAGHAGQGLDIAGLYHLMPAVVETGDTKDLFDSLQAIHVYKTGGAAGSLCGVACVLAEATKEQRKKLENFGTQLGLAFQIVDDALNLKGFEGDLKEVGEDIRDGKITYPIIKGMGRLNKFDRQYIWSIMQEHTEDAGKIASVIAMLNKVGAIDDCLVEARNLVETAWEALDPLLPDSLPKLMMRTFCGYLTERTF